MRAPGGASGTRHVSAAQASAVATRSWVGRRSRSRCRLVSRHGDERLLEVGAYNFEVTYVDTAAEELSHYALGIVGQQPDAVALDLDRLEWQASELRLGGRRLRRVSDPLARDPRLDLRRRGVGDHLATVDDDDPPGKLIRLLEVVGREHDRAALGRKS